MLVCVVIELMIKVTTFYIWQKSWLVLIICSNFCIIANTIRGRRSGRCVYIHNLISISQQLALLLPTGHNYCNLQAIRTKVQMKKYKHSMYEMKKRRIDYEDKCVPVRSDPVLLAQDKVSSFMQWIEAAAGWLATQANCTSHECSVFVPNVNIFLSHQSF